MYKPPWLGHQELCPAYARGARLSGAHLAAACSTHTHTQLSSQGSTGSRAHTGVEAGPRGLRAACRFELKSGCIPAACRLLASLRFLVSAPRSCTIAVSYNRNSSQHPWLRTCLNSSHGAPLSSQGGNYHPDCTDISSQSPCLLLSGLQYQWRPKQNRSHYSLRKLNAPERRPLNQATPPSAQRREGSFDPHHPF